MKLAPDADEPSRLAGEYACFDRENSTLGSKPEARFLFFVGVRCVVDPGTDVSMGMNPAEVGTTVNVLVVVVVVEVLVLVDVEMVVVVVVVVLVDVAVSL